MKLFIDIGHPAHVHYFKHLIHELKAEGNKVIITARDKEMAHYLLKQEGLDYISRGSGSDNLTGKIFYLLKADRTIYKIAKRENPDLFLSFASPYCAQVAWILGKPCVTLDDTETAALNHFLYKPFTTKILTPESFRKNMGVKQVRFPSFIELAYLHPNRFQPDKTIYEELGLGEGENYVILRFVRHRANHDMGVKGLSNQNKFEVVHSFEKYGRVFISSETRLPNQLQKYALNIESSRIHHVLASASLFYGESATMASESAALGTPAVFINNNAERLGTIQAQFNKYGLVFPFTESGSDQNSSINKGIKILNESPKKWDQKREKMLQTTIDTTSFLKDYLRQNALF